MMSIAELQQGMVADMLAHGVQLVGEIIADGQLHRYPSANHRAGSRNIAAILHPDNNPRGWWQDFKTGISKTVSFNGEHQRLSHADKLLIQAAKLERQQQIQEGWGNAARIAHNLYRDLPPARQSHFYLSRKKVSGYDLKQRSTDLMMPIFNEDMVIVNCQYISASGFKTFEKGGRVAGCFGKIGAETETLVIAEGYSTAASIHETTGLFCVIGLSANNLLKVAQVWRKLRPNSTILIAADNDLNLVGQQAAEKAASACDGKVITPPTSGFDWNDEINHGGVFPWKI
jgi:putative DNA primase/helicase